MKLSLILVAAFLAVAYAQIKLPTTSEAELKAILSTKEGAKEFVNCVKKPKECKDSRAHSVATLAPMLMRAQGKCKKVKGIVCTPQDEKNIRYVISTLSGKYNGLYRNLLRFLL